MLLWVKLIFCNWNWRCEKAWGSSTSSPELLRMGGVPPLPTLQCYKCLRNLAVLVSLSFSHKQTRTATHRQRETNSHTNRAWSYIVQKNELRLCCEEWLIPTFRYCRFACACVQVFGSHIIASWASYSPRPVVFQIKADWVSVSTAAPLLSPC